MAHESSRQREEKEILILVSPICEASLEAAKRLRKWASERGYSVREVSILEVDGQEYLLEFGVKKVPAVIFGGKLISEGKLKLPEVV
ncbi:MAG TPA: hypothetical protein ENF57_00460 [Candidatus Korarchaeota archaeon]|nr:hypothetical protein [Candidatus Korarchaeota archaeon]